MSSPTLLTRVPRLTQLLAALRRSVDRPIYARGRHDGPRPRFNSSDELVKAHFEARADSDHVNFTSLLETLRLLNEAPSVILETGSSAWGTDSSRLFDAYVAAFGGWFWTVDIRLEPMLELRGSLSHDSTLVCDDSVRFLERWTKWDPGRRADLVYLDSWDLDVRSPVPAAMHGLREFFAISPALTGGSLLLVDDTPGKLEWFPEHMRAPAADFHSAYDLFPGKGMLIDLYLQTRPDVRKVHHRYQALYRFEG
jgi:hypothetical protein